MVDEHREIPRRQTGRRDSERRIGTERREEEISIEPDKRDGIQRRKDDQRSSKNRRLSIDRRND